MQNSSHNNKTIFFKLIIKYLLLKFQNSLKVNMCHYLFKIFILFKNINHFSSNKSSIFFESIDLIIFCCILNVYFYNL